MATEPVGRPETQPNMKYSAGGRGLRTASAHLQRRLADDRDVLPRDAEGVPSTQKLLLADAPQSIVVSFE